MERTGLQQTPSPSPDRRSSDSSASPKLTPVEAERVIRDASDRARRTNAAHAAGRPQTIGAAVAAAMPALTADPEAIRRDEEERAARKRREARIVAWSGSQVPPKYQRVPLEPDWAALPERVDGRPVREPYREAFGRLLAIECMPNGGIVALLGDRGPGKTHMGCTLIKRFCSRGKSAMYAEAADYFRALRGTYGDRGQGTERDVIARYRAPLLLVVDAVEEKNDASAAQQRDLTDLLNKRLMDEKLTLLISNDDGSTLPERIGKSLADRVNDGGGVIVCDWPSLRGHVGGRQL